MKEGLAKTVLSILLGVLAGLCLASVVILIVYGRYYQDRVRVNTTLNQDNISNMTREEVKAILRDDLSAFTVTVLEPNGTETITGADIGLMDPSIEEVVDDLFKEEMQRSWLLAPWNPKDYEVELHPVIAVDQFRQKAQNMRFYSAYNDPPVNAEIEVKEGMLVVRPESPGRQMLKDEAMQAVENAFLTMSDSVDLTAPEFFVQPDVKVNDEDFQEELSKLRTYLGSSLEFTFGDDTKIIDQDEIVQFLVPEEMDEDDPAEMRFQHYDLSLQAIDDYLEAWGHELDTYGKEWEFVTHDGEQITVPSGGNYGWMISEARTAEVIYEEIQNGTRGEVAPVWRHEAKGWTNGGLTDTYIEISIEDQHMWCYVDGECVIDTDVVTGKLTEDRHTIPGVFSIAYKKSPAVLGSYAVQGYESPVTFWCPFNQGQGIHDASWRSRYGGTIYKSSGSHGCVNTPYDAMKVVYENCEAGEAVVVYE